MVSSDFWYNYYNMKIVHIGTATKKEKKEKNNLTREKT